MGKSVKLTVILESCYQCQHLDHSGAFTQGGARDICGHYNACDFFPSKTKEQFWEEYPYYKKRDGDIPDNHWKHHWYNRTIADVESIPECCPLKHGSGY